MIDEYQKNKKEQRSLFKKYQEYLKKGLLYLPLSVAILFLMPYLGVADALIETFGIGEGLAATISVFARLGATLGTFLGGITNIFKAKKVKDKINNNFDYEDGLVEALKIESSEKTSKINELEKKLANQKVNTSNKVIKNNYTNTINNSYTKGNEEVKKTRR